MIFLFQVVSADCVLINLEKVMLILKCSQEVDVKLNKPNSQTLTCD